MFRGMVIDSGAQGELLIKIPTTRSASARFNLKSPLTSRNVSSGSGDVQSEENVPFFPTGGNSTKQGDCDASVIQFKKKNADGATVCCACSAFAMSLSLLALICLCVAIYVRLDSTLTSVENQVSPHASSMLESTVNILLNTRNATDSLSRMGRNTDTLVKTSVPRLVTMLNSTQAMLERVQQFARKPSISIGPSAFLSTGV